MSIEHITLHRGPNGWLMTSTDPLIREAFGTDTIPTAFTNECHADVVRHEISRLNPQAIVEVVS